MPYDIRPRDVRFGLSANPQRHWLRGEFAATAIFDCFSVMLPEGERTIYRSVRHYRDQVDAELAGEIDKLSKQEAFHSREHRDYNAAMAELGYPVEKMEERLRNALRKINHPRKALAATCAIEHFATTFAGVVLKDPKILDEAGEPYRTLWLWHAVEELEHSAVAIDVLNAVIADWSPLKRYFFRVAVFTKVAKDITKFYFMNIADYARAEGIQPGLRLTMRIAYALVVNPGLSRKALLTFLSYYKPGFRGQMHYDEATIARWRAYIDGPDGTAQYS